MNKEKNMIIRNTKGQSMVEYLLLVGIAIVIYLLFLNPFGGIFQRAANVTLETNINSMTNMSDRIFNP